MNWVGGVRSRLRTKNEKKIQQQYFENRREEKKLGVKQTFDSSFKNHGFSISQDMLSLKTVLKSHDNLLKKKGLNICNNKPRHVELNNDSLKSRINYNRSILTSSPVLQKSNLLLINTEDGDEKSTVQCVFINKLQESFENPILKSNPPKNSNAQNYGEKHTRQLSSTSIDHQLSQQQNYQSSEEDQLVHQKNPNKRKSEYCYFIEGLKKIKKCDFNINKESSDYETTVLTKFKNENKKLMDVYQQSKVSISSDSVSSIVLNKKYSSLFQNIDTPQILISSSPEVPSTQNNVVFSPPKNLINYQTRMNGTSNELIDSISKLEYRKTEEKEFEFYPYKKPGQHSKFPSFCNFQKNLCETTTGFSNKKTSIDSPKVNTSIESPNVNTSIESSNANSSIESSDKSVSIKSPNMNISIDSPNVNIQVARFLDDCTGIISTKEDTSSWASSIPSNQPIKSKQDVFENNKDITESNDKSYKENSCSSFPIKSMSSFINIPTISLTNDSPVINKLTNNISEKVTHILHALNKRDKILNEQHLGIMTALKLQKYGEILPLF